MKTVFDLLVESIEAIWKMHGADIHKKMSAHSIPGDEQQHMDTLHQTMKHADPSETYHPWLARKYISGEVNLGNMHELKGPLDTLKRSKEMLKTFGRQHDITKMSPEDVKEVHRDFHGAVAAKGRGDTSILTDPQHADHEEDEHWHHYNLKTPEAATQAAKHTSWCTASPHMFNHYVGKNGENGSLHCLVPKVPAYHGEKYQIHVEPNGRRGQSMNENDRTLSPKEASAGRPGHITDKFFTHSNSPKLSSYSYRGDGMFHPEGVRNRSVRFPEEAYGEASDEDKKKFLKNISGQYKEGSFLHASVMGSIAEHGPADVKDSIVKDTTHELDEKHLHNFIKHGTPEQRDILFNRYKKSMLAPPDTTNTGFNPHALRSSFLEHGSLKHANAINAWYGKHHPLNGLERNSGIREYAMEKLGRNPNFPKMTAVNFFSDHGHGKAMNDIFEHSTELQNNVDLAHHPDQLVRRSLATHSNHPEVQRILANDKDSYVKRHLAYKTDDPEIHRVLMHDPDFRVRKAVAEKADDSIKKEMVGDPHEAVAMGLAQTGNISVKNKFTSHPNSAVREIVANHFPDKMFKDPDPTVRSVVAITGSRRHHKVLMHDPHPNVRNYVATSADKDIVKEMEKTETHPEVMDAIHYKLHGGDYE